MTASVTVDSPVRARLGFAPFRSRDQCFFFTSVVLTRVLVNYARLACPFCPFRGPKAGQGNKCVFLYPKVD